MRCVHACVCMHVCAYNVHVYVHVHVHVHWVTSIFTSRPVCDIIMAVRSQGSCGSLNQVCACVHRYIPCYQAQNGCHSLSDPEFHE